MSTTQFIAIQNETVEIFLQTLHTDPDSIANVLISDQTFRFGKGVIQWSLHDNKPSIVIMLDCRHNVIWTLNWAPPSGQAILVPRRRDISTERCDIVINAPEGQKPVFEMVKYSPPDSHGHVPDATMWLKGDIVIRLEWAQCFLG
ncbi:hypothetical protein HYFRA_00013268 [Hymenoscyphus fraxineus]|uniref:Uncharacterized protein n=1 Tax=Hymenoscyphus fraxineus TaxID=746836 RepID=A0A9N9LCZ6_9HELO|nr:hypothetical protein HYFRA_00013268 [Hymenoscyphus fraxineus]